MTDFQNLRKRKSFITVTRKASLIDNHSMTDFASNSHLETSLQNLFINASQVFSRSSFSSIYQSKMVDNEFNKENM